MGPKLKETRRGAYIPEKAGASPAGPIDVSDDLCIACGHGEHWAECTAVLDELFDCGCMWNPSISFRVRRDESVPYNSGHDEPNRELVSGTDSGVEAQPSSVSATAVLILKEMVQQRDEYRDLAEGFHEMQMSNGWCDCHKGGGEGICDLAKTLKELRQDGPEAKPVQRLSDTQVKAGSSPAGPTDSDSCSCGARDCGCWDW